MPIGHVPNSAADLWVSFEVSTAVFDIPFMEHHWTLKCTTYIGYVYSCVHGHVRISLVYTAVSTFAGPETLVATKRSPASEDRGAAPRPARA